MGSSFIPQICESISCLDDEDMVLKAYGGMVSLMQTIDIQKKSGMVEFMMHDGGRASRKRAQDFGPFIGLVNSLYIPGSTRCFWSGGYDPSDEPLPDEGCVYIKPRYSGVQFEFINVKRLKHLPSKVICSIKNPLHIYKAYSIMVPDDGDLPICGVSYFIVAPDHKVYPTIDRLKLRDPFWANHFTTLKHDRQFMGHYGPGALSLLADRRHLWNIRTKEPIRFPEKPDVDGFYATVDFGVEQEMVKSLVFARDTPITPTGRKRPILHWVQQHKRRIASGIDVDVTRHLRGITEFEMGDLHFEITSPQKPGY